MSRASLTAAIITVGSELTMGLRIDTNTAEIARALVVRGFEMIESVSVGDSEELLASQIARLAAVCDLVITTGGLGPTHDDITRQAASEGLGIPIVVSPELESWLQPAVVRHTDPVAAAQVLVQAEVLEGAKIIAATTGTAPGLVVKTTRGSVVALLPGPPTEMRPMLEELLAQYPSVRAQVPELGAVGLTESDAQQVVSRAIAHLPGVGFTILARPGDVRVLLTDAGAGAPVLADAFEAAAIALGPACYTRSGRTLAEEVVSIAKAAGVTVAVAESCTGGMVAAALTDVAGSSGMFVGGAVTYSNDSKVSVLGVDPKVLEVHGAVSAQCVTQMASGAASVFGADVALAVSGIAGPDGGTADKPVGTVWFGVASASGIRTVLLNYPPVSRDSVRSRATAAGLNLIRTAIVDRADQAG